jgi:hypothetical protein
MSRTRSKAKSNIINEVEEEKVSIVIPLQP